MPGFRQAVGGGGGQVAGACVERGEGGVEADVFGAQRVGGGRGALPQQGVNEGVLVVGVPAEFLGQGEAALGVRREGAGLVEVGGSEVGGQREHAGALSHVNIPVEVGPGHVVSWGIENE